MRVVLAEDSLLFREGMLRLLADLGHDVVEAVADGDGLVAAVDGHDPQLVIADVRMPPGDAGGVDAARNIRARHPSTGILLLSQHIELHRCRALIGTPGFGYLLKDRVLDLGAFADAMDRVAAGGIALDPQVIQALVRTSNSALHTLTARELDILSFAAQGRSNIAIGSELHLSERTVESHMRAVFTKLGLIDTADTNRRVTAVLTYLEQRPSAERASG